MDVLPLPQLLEKYTLLAIEELPSNTETQVMMAIAEGARLAAYYNSGPDGRIVPTSPQHIRNWVVRKLRSVIPDLRTNGNQIVDEAVSGIFTPGLEFMGDIIRLDDGNLLPGPTRVVPVGGEHYNLVSGVPTREFVSSGVKIESIGAIRRVEWSSLLAKIASKQSLDSYLELDWFDNRKSYIDYILETGQQIDWDPNRSFEGYLGYSQNTWGQHKNKGPYGFKNWGCSPLEVDVNGKLISLWREELWGQFNYWLRVKHKLERVIIVDVVENGRLIKRFIEHQIKVIKVPNELFRFIALELESRSGIRRGIKIMMDGNRSTLAISFAPPDSLRRWLFACGSSFSGYSQDMMIWPIPAWAIDETVRIAKRLKIYVETTVGEGENGITRGDHRSIKV